MTDYQPTIIIDSREKLPLPVSRFPGVTDTLVTGDYSIQGLETLFAVERKSIADLTACCVGTNRTRFERQLQRLKGVDFARLLIVGSREDIENHRYTSRIAPKAVLHSLAAFEVRYLVPVVWAATPEIAAQMIEEWVWWFSREQVERVNRMLGVNVAKVV